MLSEVCLSCRNFFGLSTVKLYGINLHKLLSSHSDHLFLLSKWLFFILLQFYTEQLGCCDTDIELLALKRILMCYYSSDIVTTAWFSFRELIALKLSCKSRAQRNKFNICILKQMCVPLWKSNVLKYR